MREQARALGLEHRWREIARAYAEVNLLFGDIVKVTPTSKVVGDMALFMVANDLSIEAILDPQREIAFPDSVVSMFKGELGFPAGGFPKALTKKILKDTKPLKGRAGKYLPAADLNAKRAEAEKIVGHKIADRDLASYLMYPKVYCDYAAHVREFDDVSVLPTSAFFYGLKDREEIAVDIARGKTLVIRLQGNAELDDEGHARLFFELNGQSRVVRVAKAGIAVTSKQKPKADPTNAAHVGAPMPGAIVTVSIKVGQSVKKGDPLISIEAMKMESMLRAERDGIVKAVYVKSGDAIAAKDLLLEFN